MTVYYRGIPEKSDINEIQSDNIIWVTDSPEYASEYGEVYELEIDDENCSSIEDLYDIAEKYGYDTDGIVNCAIEMIK